jgi:hypothetical protein
MKLSPVLVAFLLPAIPGCLDDSGSPKAAVLGVTSAGTCGEPLDVALLACRNTPVGSVTVSNSEDTLYLLVATRDGWSMTLSHLALGCDPAELPQTRSGNPVPGRFPYSRSYIPPASQDLYALPLPSFPCREIFVAFHADVAQLDSSGRTVREESAWAAGEPFPGRNWGMYFRYSVRTCEPPPPPTTFVTYTQEAWGDAPSPDNAAGYLSARFGDAFPGGLMIGSPSGNWALFTDAQAVLDFLPQAGRPGPLDGRSLNPRDLQNVLAGQATALTLNITFDSIDPAFSPHGTPLAELVVADPASPCVGLRVDEVLRSANEVLGGFPGRFAPEEINECVTRINENFENGQVDRGYLRLP